MSAHTNEYDTTPRQIERMRDQDKLRTRLYFGSVILIMFIVWLAGRYV